MSKESLDGSFTTCLSSDSSSSLVSRLDRLDSMTTYLEHKRHSSRWAGGEVGMTQKQPVPLDLAVEEAQSKGSLMDRISSLEDRLIQLCSLIESKNASPSRSTTADKISLVGLRRKASSFSLSRLRPSHKVDSNASVPSMGKFSVTDQKQDDHKSQLQNETSITRKSKKCTTTNGRSGKREAPSGRLRLKLLGC